MHDFSWNAVVWGWLFCGAMFLLGRTIDHKDVIINLRKVLGIPAMLAIAIPGLLVGIPYLGAHVISLFSNWAMLRDLLLFDVILLPYLIGLVILSAWTSAERK
jgi:hypothetical protein